MVRADLDLDGDRMVTDADRGVHCTRPIPHNRSLSLGLFGAPPTPFHPRPNWQPDPLGRMAGRDV
jgi:hypothetical protein